MSEIRDDRIKGMLAEYNSLREESLSLGRTSEVIDKMFLLVFVAILAAQSHMGSAWLLFLAGWFIGLSLAYKYRKDQEGMYKIGQYIKVFLENDNSGLGWQLRQALLPEDKDNPAFPKKLLKDPFKKLPERFPERIRGVFYPTSIAMAILAVLFTIDLSEKLRLPILPMICGILLVLGLHFVLIDRWATRKSYAGLRNYWEGKWENVKADLCGQMGLPKGQE